MRHKDFLGLHCFELVIDGISLLITQSVGPRIISLCFNRSKNIFAELPDVHLDHSQNTKFTLYGGHRLWIAPEEKLITYSPDDQAIRIEGDDQAVSLIQDVDKFSGFQKGIKISRTAIENTIVIDHSLTNRNNIPKTVAAWAITQFKLGGVAIIPINGLEIHNPYLPNRSLILWPYTDVYDSRINIEDDYIFIQTSKSTSVIKIGVPNFQKWLAYQIDNILFIKYSNHFHGKCEPDLGAAGQCYTNNQFLELETLSPLRELEPGDSIHHREIWRVMNSPFREISCQAIAQFFSEDQNTKKCLEILGES